MDRRALLLHGGLCGLVGNLLMIASVPVAPPWPPFGASVDVVVAWFRDNHDGFAIQAWLAALGVVPLVGFSGALGALLHERGKVVTAALIQGAMVAFVSGFAINWTPWVAIAMRPDRDPAVVQALYDIGLIGQFVGVGACLAWLFVGVFHAAMLRVIPRAFVVPAAVAIPLNVALAAATAPEGALSPSGVVGMASIPVFGLTFTACAIWMLVEARRVGRGGG